MLFTKSCAIKFNTFSRLVRYTSTFRTSNMEGVYVRCIPSDEKMQITLNYKRPGGNIKTFNMDRFRVEEVGKTILRLKTNILKTLIKKKKKKKEDQAESTSEPDLKIWMSIKGACVDDDKTPVHQVFVKGAVLHIEDQNYPVEVNLPTILALILPKNIMVGFPIYPKIQVEFCDLQDCSFVWYKENIVDEPSKRAKTTVLCVKVGDTFSYTPLLSDLGHKLKVTCVPKLGERCGGEFSVLSKCDVEAGPGLCPFENRHMYTQNVLDDHGIRVISYNILADIYADSDFSRTELFPYCPPYALAIDYRKQLLAKEITGYNADVICLQEVDRKVYINDLLPTLDVLGYDGALQVKGGEMPEGEAIFFRKSKFRQVEDCSIELRKAINNDVHYADIKDKISQNEALKQEMADRGTIVQVLVLESLINPGYRLCVANTHLYFHPKACCVRSLQTITIIRHLEQIMKEQQSQGYRVSLIFCGDFNCSPRGGGVDFITKKHIGPDNYSWSINAKLTLEGMDFSHGLDLRNGCGKVDYTNYAGNFHEQLDYIFIDQSLEVTQVIPNPEHSEVEQHIALPSVVFPSDHIAQICDLKWNYVLE